MARELAYTVWVKDEKNQDVSFGPGDKVPAWASKQMGDHVWAEGGTGDDADGYDGQTVADLNAEIDQRNKGRADDGKITAESGKKADLVAALEADDAAQQ